MRLSPRWARRLGVLALAAAGHLVAPAALCGVTVTFDIDTLNAILPAMTLERIEVPLTEGRSIGVELRDLRVTGLEPTNGSSPGAIRTSLRLRVPSLGVDLPVEPRLALSVVPGPEGSLLEMRFVDLPLRVPFAGSINVAAFLPPMRFPADNVWQVEGAQRAASVQSRLIAVELGQREMRFRFALAAVP